MVGIDVGAGDEGQPDKCPGMSSLPDPDPGNCSHILPTLRGHCHFCVYQVEHVIMAFILFSIIMIIFMTKRYVKIILIKSLNCVHTVEGESQILNISF